MVYTMSSCSTQNNPLHIPEIRSRVSRFISVVDALSCVRVSKDWSTDFVSPIWFTVNFSTHSSFEQVDAKVIAKHGHLIHNVLNLSTQGQLNVLLYPDIRNVRVLSVSCTATLRFHIFCMDLVRNNNKSLETLSLKIGSKDVSNRTVPLDAIVPPSRESRLSTITLCNISVSRTSFVTLLKGCPLLRIVNLQKNFALLSGPVIDTFKHPGVHYLSVHLEGVFRPDLDSEVTVLGFSLLVHFPNLIEWTLYPLEETLIVPIERITAELDEVCSERFFRSKE